MFKPQECPNCGVIIEKLEFSPQQKSAKWYALIRLEFVCPYCGKGIEYDKKLQRKAFKDFLLVAVPSVLFVVFGEGGVVKGGTVLFFLSGVVGLVVFSKKMKLVAKK